jgi:hypothetical protein
LLALIVKLETVEDRLGQSVQFKYDRTSLLVDGVLTVPVPPVVHGCFHQNDRSH